MTNNIKVISIRENQAYMKKGLAYIQKTWASENTMKLYEDCIEHMTDSETLLPQWYLLEIDGELVGCGGLITNDFISRMDLYPWVCAIFVEEEYRGNAYGKLLIDRAKEDTLKAGFKNLYLCTDHIGYYEKYGFTYIGDGYHPWGESSRIYKCGV